MIDEIRKFVMLDDNTRGIVYIASNKINHKIYIGMSMQNLTKRKLEHKSISKKNSNSYFHYAIKKYGFDNFEWFLLFKSNDKDTLLNKEKYFIKLFNSNLKNIGYNSSTGGEYPILNEEVRRKQSSIKKGKYNGIKNPFYGHHHTKETKLKFSESRRGKKISGFVSHTEETKKTLSKRRIEWCNNLENRKKLSLQNQNRTLVYCLELNKYFNSIKEASLYFNINYSTFKDNIKKEYYLGYTFILKLANGMDINSN